MAGVLDGIDAFVCAGFSASVLGRRSGTNRSMAKGAIRDIKS